MIVLIFNKDKDFTDLCLKTDVYHLLKYCSEYEKKDVLKSKQSDNKRYKSMIRLILFATKKYLSLRKSKKVKCFLPNVQEMQCKAGGK